MRAFKTSATLPLMNALFMNTAEDLKHNSLIFVDGYDTTTERLAEPFSVFVKLQCNQSFEQVDWLLLKLSSSLAASVEYNHWIYNPDNSSLVTFLFQRC